MMRRGVAAAAAATAGRAAVCVSLSSASTRATVAAAAAARAAGVAGRRQQQQLMMQGARAASSSLSSSPSSSSSSSSPWPRPAVGKIVAVARNYALHAAELNNPVPGEPVVFLKPASSLLLTPPAAAAAAAGGAPSSVQAACEVPPDGDIHHEVELGVLIGAAGRDVPEGRALEHVAGYCVAVDLTSRSLQGEAKKAGLPWTVAKGFDTACPVGAFVPASAVSNAQDVELWLEVNGEERQRGSTALMLFNIARLIANSSRVMALEPGDLLLTGTPHGVGPVVEGDVVTFGASAAGFERAGGAFVVRTRQPVPLDQAGPHYTPPSGPATLEGLD